VKRYLVRRVSNALVVMLAVTLFTFSLLHLAPGSPVSLLVDETATREEIAAVERRLGLDQPLPVQYMNYVSRILRGDLGDSIVYRKPGFSLVLERLPATLELALFATLVTILVGIPFGVLMALRPRTLSDTVGSFVTLFGVSTPGFWLGLMFILLFAVELGWLPTSGRGPAFGTAVGATFGGHPEQLATTLKHLALPGITLAASNLAFIARLTRSSVLEELSQLYVRAARARGLPWPLVTVKHVLRNALMPTITVLGLEIAGIVGGAVIIETVYGWPGVGQLVFQSIGRRDYPLAQGAILMISSFVVTMTLLVDLAYLYLDPRVRLA
jgi:ABC-type dipeptide/oligopeptide/nickel transport system permease component